MSEQVNDPIAAAIDAAPETPIDGKPGKPGKARTLPIAGEKPVGSPWRVMTAVAPRRGKVYQRKNKANVVTGTITPLADVIIASVADPRIKMRLRVTHFQPLGASTGEPECYWPKDGYDPLFEDVNGFDADVFLRSAMRRAAEFYMALPTNDVAVSQSDVLPKGFSLRK